MSKDARKPEKPEDAFTVPVQGDLIAPKRKGLLSLIDPAKLPKPLEPGRLFGVTASPPRASVRDAGLDSVGNKLTVAASTKPLRAFAGDGTVRAQAVSYEEYSGSPIFDGTAQELTAQSMWRVLWSDIELLYLTLFPGPIVGVPQLPMLMPNSLVLRASQARFEPEFDEALIVANDGNNHYDHSKVTITWKTIPFNQSNPGTDQIITRRISVSGEFMTIPGWGCLWDIDDDFLLDSSGSAGGSEGGAGSGGAGSSDRIVNEDVQAGRVIPILEHHVTLHRVPVVPYAAIRGLIGHVNQTVFEVEGEPPGAAAETILFGGAELSQTVTSDGSLPWQVELHFQERIIRQGNRALGWNHFFDTKAGAWRRMVQKNEDPIYPIGDLNLLT